MPGSQAKVLKTEALQLLLKLVARRKLARRDQVILLLSFKAGLRACEIAGLEWPMVLDSSGQIGTELQVLDRVAKGGSGRRIPLHPGLRKALILLQKTQPSSSRGPVICSSRGGHLRPNSIVNWFVELYREVGLEGCSSHSGRRTFITSLARALPNTGGSLRDVQLLAGHSSVETTQRYIDGDTVVQRKLVRSL